MKWTFLLVSILFYLNLSGCARIHSTSVRYHIDVRTGTAPEELMKLGIVPDGKESKSLIRGEILVGKDFTLTTEGKGTMSGKLYRDPTGHLHLKGKYSDNRQGTYFDNIIEPGKPVYSQMILGSGIYYSVYLVIQ